MTYEDNPRVIVPPPLIFTGLLLVGLFIDSDRNSSIGLQLLAVASGLAGLSLIALALGLFRVNKTRPEPWQPASALVVGGIFHFTRNPMYLGMAILSFSIALFFASFPAVVLTMAAVATIDLGVIRREEAYLIRRFGDEYVAYRAAVRRWI